MLSWSSVQTSKLHPLSLSDRLLRQHGCGVLGRQDIILGRALLDRIKILGALAVRQLRAKLPKTIVRHARALQNRLLPRSFRLGMIAREWRPIFFRYDWFPQRFSNGVVLLDPLIAL